MKLVRNVWKIGMSDLIKTVDDCLEVGALMTVKPPAIYEREERSYLVLETDTIFLSHHP